MDNESILRVGDTVRAKFPLYESATGDHPCFIMAKAGERLLVRRENNPQFEYGLMVENIDSKDFPFFV